MIARGRNSLQAHNDEYAIVLERLFSEVPEQIKSSFCELEQEIDKTAADFPSARSIFKSQIDSDMLLKYI